MCATQLIPITSLLHRFLNLAKMPFLPCYAPLKFMFISSLQKLCFFPQINFKAEFIIIFAAMSDVSISIEGNSQRLTLLLWIGWKKERERTAIELSWLIFLFEDPDSSDIKLVSSVCKAFLLLMEPTCWQLLLLFYMHKKIWNRKWRNLI